MTQGIWVWAKRGAAGVAFVCALPLILPTWIEAILTERRSERAFTAGKEFFAPWPSMLGQYLRAAYYRACCDDVSWDVCLLQGAMIAHRETTIGARVAIGCYSIIGRARIADDVLISSKVSIISGKYQHGRPSEAPSRPSSENQYETISIAKNTWIGENAVIAANVGEGCSIGAGATLFREAPDHSTFVGNPARRVDRALSPGD